MKCYAPVDDPKDVTTKEYVDAADSVKLEEKDLTELTNPEVLTIWNTIFGSEGVRNGD